jgi:hypothetical protein
MTHQLPAKGKIYFGYAKLKKTSISTAKSNVNHILKPYRIINAQNDKRYDQLIGNTQKFN